MPNNQNPVFTDNSTILGDGTIEDPLHSAGGGGGVTEVESTDGSVAVTNPTGPIVDLSIAPPGNSFGNILIWDGTKFQNPVVTGQLFIDSNGAGGIQVVMFSTSSADSPAMLLENIGGSGDHVIINAGTGAGGGPGPFQLRQDGSIKAAGLHVNFPSLQIFANNAAAIAGGLNVGDLYRSGGDPDQVSVVH